MADAKSDISPALEKALTLIQASDEKAAEATVIQSVRDADTVHGKGSPELARAYNDLGSVLMQLGRYQAAIEAFAALRRTDSRNRPGQGGPPDVPNQPRSGVSIRRQVR